jgi:hypothetical protein
MRILPLLALPAILLTTMVPALASSTHRVYNLSDTCAWVTIDEASYTRGWHNVAAGFIKPGQHNTWTLGNMVHIKVRTEPRQTADCASKKIADEEIRESSSFGSTLGNSEATLRRRDYGGGFLLVWGR